jgi:hypothetical protein
MYSLGVNQPGKLRRGFDNTSPKATERWAERHLCEPPDRHFDGADHGVVEPDLRLEDLQPPATPSA